MNPKRILVVDDDSSLRKTLVDILGDKGYTPLAARMGQEALDKVNEEAPAVALIDLKLEDMSGLEVMAKIKKGAPGTECILLTGHASQASAIEAINLGAYSYVQKPYEIEQLLVTVRHAVEKQEAEQALRESEHRYKRLLESVTDYIYTVKIEDGRPVTTAHAPGCEAVTGYTLEEYEADPYLWYRMVHDEDREAVTEQATKSITGEVVPPLEHRIIHKDGSIRWVRNTYVPRRNEKGQLVAYDGLIADITERKQAEKEKEKLQNQLLQSQKMEAIGRLTGGIAHDFNNQLTVIIGFTELMQYRMPPDNPFREMVDKVYQCGQHAADLVRQLLAFSRKQIIEPKVLDLNQIVVEVKEMLGRIIGENTKLEVSLAADLWPVKADPAQLEQIIINLSVNARDAMPEGGRLTIETVNVTLNETYTASYFEVKPGEYVLLTVSDTGVGISEEIKMHIFEPFFTTKETGQGTGLGLATVYGVVDQSGGDIQVYSQEGVGTVFKIYLPSVMDKIPQASRPKVELEMPTGDETILLVEDETGVRELICQILEELGYTLLQAENGQEAIQVSAHHSAPIDLLLTDVVLPDLNGKALSEELLQARPDMRVLFMSGYTHNTIARHGVLDPDVAFIQKPLPSVALAHKVRDLLDD